ncbi:uncharacterized protein LOC144646190 [Oculina patagonica]
MGCGSSTATRTAEQPAPKLKRIKEEDENATRSSSKQKSSSRSSVQESNGHAKRITENEENEEESSRKQTRKVVTPPSSVNGHVPHDSQESAVSNSGVSRSTSDEQTNEDVAIDTRDNVEPTHAGEIASNGLDNTVAAEEVTVPERSASSVQEKQLNKEESLEEGAPASDHSATHSKISVEEEQPVVMTSSSPVGEKGVPGALPGDDVKPVKEKSVSTGDEGGTGPAETDSALREFSEGSLSEENGTAPVLAQSKRASVAASEHSAAPSDNEVNLSRQNRGSVELESVSPATTEGAQPSQPIEISKEDSASLGGNKSFSDQRIAQDSVSAPAETSEPSRPTEIAQKDSVALDRKDSVGLPTDDEFLESIQGRICTLTASVMIGSVGDPQGERTVTLNGSVYRLPRVTSPKPGDKIGFVKGDVTSIPLDNEASEKVATLRGDLLAVSGEAASHGHIATASIDVVSCATGEKIATITADVSPDDDPENASGVISGEVLRASETGSRGDTIGTVEGKVVALTFDEDTVSITSGDEEFLKLRRESCFI